MPLAGLQVLIHVIHHPLSPFQSLTLSNQFLKGILKEAVLETLKRARFLLTDQSEHVNDQLIRSSSCTVGPICYGTEVPDQRKTFRKTRALQ